MSRVWARGRLAAAVGVAAVAVALTGCAADARPAKQDFDGPWAAEFKLKYNESTSGFVRSVLEDGTISYQEYQEMRDRYRSCLAASGIELSDRDGSSEFTFPPSLGAARANKVENECSTSSGEFPIGALYTWIQRNSENLDEDAIMAECLVRTGTVEPGYTAKDHAADAPTREWPFIDAARGRDMYEACNDDPLGLLDGL